MDSDPLTYEEFLKMKNTKDSFFERYLYYKYVKEFLNHCPKEYKNNFKYKENEE